MEIIRGYEVVFDPIMHQYFVNGKKVPSVSQICKMENPQMYLGINEKTLQNAQRKGTDLHKQIEDFEAFGVIDENLPEMKNYVAVKKQYDIIKEMSEKMVIIEHRGRIVCAGRFDFFGLMEGKPALIDFKRTYQIHQSYVALQLNLYRLGFIQCYGKNIEKLAVIRLRYHDVEVMPIAINEDHVFKVLDKYEL